METEWLDTAKSNVTKLSGLIPYRGQIPRLHPSVFIAEGANSIGDVQIEKTSCIWSNTVVCGDAKDIIGSLL